MRIYAGEREMRRNPHTESQFRRRPCSAAQFGCRIGGNQARINCGQLARLQTDNAALCGVLHRIRGGWALAAQIHGMCDIGHGTAPLWCWWQVPTRLLSSAGRGAWDNPRNQDGPGGAPTINSLGSTFQESIPLAALSVSGT